LHRAIDGNCLAAINGNVDSAGVAAAPSFARRPTGAAGGGSARACRTGYTACVTGTARGDDTIFYINSTKF
jgi:hypothetical protein